MRGQPALSNDAAAAHLYAVPGWWIEGGGLRKRFVFDDFTQVLVFASAVGWMGVRQDHHPDLLLDSRSCTVAWTTHDVGGLSMNDFICAARTDALR